MLRVTIDEARGVFSEGTTVLAAARALGVDIPTLCHDPRLVPTGACRLCLVEIDGAGRPAAACSAPIQDGMVVRTATPALAAERAMVLELLARDYPPTDVSLPPRNEFERLLCLHGIEARGDTGPHPVDESHPHIRVDMSQCIDCYRCVRICHEVQGQDVWHLWDRGFETVVHPAGESLLESPCVGCGACVDTCPSGALTDRRAPATGADLMLTRTVCPYCGVGCELDYAVQDGRIVAAHPVMDAPVNHGHACVKGRYAFDFVHAADRVTEPLVRRDGHWRPVSWEEAVAETAGRLRAIVAAHGPDAVGVLGSARATNEDNYVTQKFARVAIGTNNVDCCARVCHAPSAAALKGMLGAGAATNGFDDIERAKTIVICGANPNENHPVVGARIHQAARHGATLIVIDPRRTELAGEAAVHLALRPGTNVPLLQAMAHVILDEGLYDAAYVAARVDGLDAFRASVAPWTPARAAALCGVPETDIVRAARLIATGGPAMSIHGLGVTEHAQGTDGVRALVNLALLTGNIGRPGAGVNPLRGQNNVQGAAQMGCDPGSLAGGIPLAQGRERTEAVWKHPVPLSPGLKALDMIDAAIDGRLKALIVVGYDILLTNPNSARTRRALEALDLLVVVDLFQTETASLAHVFLPACSSFEKDGTFMNAERRVQRVRRVIPPVGGARPDADILCDLAAALGQREGFAFANAEAIWDEVRAVWPDARGATYARLETAGLQWPCPTEDHPGTAILYTNGFPGGRAALAPLEFHGTPEIVGDAYPLLLNTGRTLHQFNAGTMTSRTPDHGLHPADTLDMAPADAAAMGVATGDRVRVRSRHGETILPVHVTDAVKAGELFATFHTVAARLNDLTSSVRDPIGTPEYKVTAVRVERLDAAGSPA